MIVSTKDTKSVSKLLFVAFAVILVATVFPLKSTAQGISTVQPGISFSVDPEFPKPEETLIVGAQSFSTDLDQADFTWTLNGTKIDSGRGVKDVIIKMGKVGVTTNLLVSVKTSDGSIIQRQFTFRPSIVTLISEASSYTPPFYKGLPLMSRGGSVKIVAIPEFFDLKGNRLNPKNLTYSWKQNNEALGNNSGYGKDSIIINQTSYLRSSDTIGVEVFSATDNLAGSGSIEIAPTENRVVLYENIPSLGTLFNHALGDNYIFNKKELTLVEVPYFISATTPTQDFLNTDWTINSTVITKFTGKDRVTIPVSQPGNGTVGVSVRHTRKVIQGGGTSVFITIPN